MSCVGLYSVAEENLKKLPSHLNMTDTESNTKRQVLKLARNAIETGVKAKSEEEALEYLEVLESFIFDTPPPLEDDGTKDPEKEKQISDLKLK